MDNERETYEQNLDRVLNIEDQLIVANKRIKELEQWQKGQLFVWGPIFAYCDDESNAKRLGIGLGESISARILEILKAYK